MRHMSPYARSLPARRRRGRRSGGLGRVVCVGCRFRRHRPLTSASRAALESSGRPSMGLRIRQSSVSDSPLCIVVCPTHSSLSCLKLAVCHVSNSAVCHVSNLQSVMYQTCSLSCLKLAVCHVSNLQSVMYQTLQSVMYQTLAGSSVSESVGPHC
jgi:hypothetical protein